MNEKNNQVPQIIVDFCDRLKDNTAPKFQKDLAAQTLERVSEMVTRALSEYKSQQPVDGKKRYQKSNTF